VRHSIILGRKGKVLREKGTRPVLDRFQDSSIPPISGFGCSS